MARTVKGRYAALEGNAWRNARCNACSIAARWLWAAGLSYCADQQTDGRIPKHMLGALLGALPDALQGADYAGELVSEGLWSTTEQGYEIVGYLDHNVSKDEWEAEGERRSERARKAARARWDGDALSNARGNARPKDPKTLRVKDPKTPPPNPPVGGDAGGVRDPVEGLTTGPGDPPPSTRAEEVIRVAEDVYRDRHGVGLGLISHRDVRRALDVWRWAESSAPDDPLGLVRSAWTRCADESTADAPWAAFAASPGRWAGDRKRKRPGFRRAATPEEFAAQVGITDDELMAAARGERTAV